MSDTPNVDLVLSDLEKEIKKPEPFVVVLSGSKRITFKDPYAFKISERREVLDLYDQTQDGQADDLDFLKRILSKSDFEAYVKEDLPIRTHEALTQRVMQHFAGGQADRGNGNASNR